MGYIRLFFVAIVVALVFTLSLPFLGITYLIGLFNMDARDRFTMGVVYVAFSAVIWASGVKVHISGKENLPQDGPVLYVGNHRSFYDVLVSYRLFPKITSFVAKKEFEHVPFLSWWMNALHNLFLDRSDIKQGLKTILKAVDYVKGGMSICIFPEGKRNRTEEDMLPFHDGSFKIADKTGCPIIPMTMYNMSAVWEDHMPQIYSQHVFIDFGTPILPDSLDKETRKHMREYVRDIMIKRYNELKEESKEYIKR